MITWKNKALKKRSLIDSCSFGELWNCELFVRLREGDWNFTGGFKKWFFSNPVSRKVRQYLYKKQWSLDTNKIGVNHVVHGRRIVSIKENG